MKHATRKENILDTLSSHQDLFEALQIRHTIWAADTADPDTQNLHLDILDCLRQMKEKYAVLLEKYQKQT